MNHKTRTWVFGLAVFALGAPAWCASDGAASPSYLLTLPPGNQNRGNTVLQLSLPGHLMPASLDKSNWQFSAAHHGIVLVNFEMNYDTFKSGADVESFYQYMMSVVEDLRSKGYGITPDHILLTGTSRGGALALALGLYHPETFHRIGIVSGARDWLWDSGRVDNAKGLRLFVVHGRDDAVIKLDRVQTTLAALKQHGAQVQLAIIDHAGHNLNSGAYAKVLDSMMEVPSH